MRGRPGIRGMRESADERYRDWGAERRTGPRRDATPSNRSAEASRAPRGHVNDDPLAPCGGRVGQPPPEPATTTPGKPPWHTTDHLRSDPPAHSGHVPLAELVPIPRSCLAAFSRLPSVRPFGFPSGFPRSHLSVLA